VLTSKLISLNQSFPPSYSSLISFSVVQRSTNRANVYNFILASSDELQAFGKHVVCKWAITGADSTSRSISELPLSDTARPYAFRQYGIGQSIEFKIWPFPTDSVTLSLAGLALSRVYNNQNKAHFFRLFSILIFPKLWHVKLLI